MKSFLLSYSLYNFDACVQQIFLLKFVIITALLQALEIITTTNAISFWLQMRMCTDDTEQLLSCSNCTGFSMSRVFQTALRGGGGGD